MYVTVYIVTGMLRSMAQLSPDCSSDEGSLASELRGMGGCGCARVKTCTVRSCNSNCALIVHVSIIMAVIAVCTCVCVCCNYLCDSVIVHCACLGSSS